MFCTNLPSSLSINRPSESKSNRPAMRSEGLLKNRLKVTLSPSWRNWESTLKGLLNNTMLPIALGFFGIDFTSCLFVSPVDNLQVVGTFFMEANAFRKLHSLWHCSLRIQYTEYSQLVAHPCRREMVGLHLSPQYVEGIFHVPHPTQQHRCATILEDAAGLANQEATEGLLQLVGGIQ